jgi:hypothetical protein
MPRCFVKPTDYWQLVSATHLRSCKTQDVFEQGRKKWAGDKLKKGDPKTRMDRDLIKILSMEKKGRIEATTILLNTRCYRFPD